MLFLYVWTLFDVRTFNPLPKWVCSLNKLAENISQHLTALLCIICRIWRSCWSSVKTLLLYVWCIEVGTEIIDLFWILLSGVFLLGCPNILNSEERDGTLTGMPWQWLQHMKEFKRKSEEGGNEKCWFCYLRKPHCILKNFDRWLFYFTVKLPHSETLNPETVNQHSSNFHW